MDKETSEILGKIVDKLPGHSVKRAGDLVITTFEKCISPLSNWLGGWGELIKLRFEIKAEHEKKLIAETYATANLKVEASGISRIKPSNINIYVAIMEYSPLETDENKRNCLSNILANEQISADIHPDIIRILSCVTYNEIILLNKISEFLEFCEDMFRRSRSNFITIIRGYPKQDRNIRATLEGEILAQPFSLAVLIKHSLVSENWYRGVTPIGVEFMRCISEPRIEAKKKKRKTREGTVKRDG